MPIKTTPAITVVFLGVKVRILELPILNRQLIRVNYDTLGDLVKDLISGKITYVTEDQLEDTPLYKWSDNWIIWLFFMRHTYHSNNINFKIFIL
ncbi:MAG: hypothetical protein WCF03_11815 [Nitrososphaeraceae archaeon]